MAKTKTKAKAKKKAPAKPKPPKCPPYINPALAALVVPIGSFTEDPQNARRHPDHNLEAIGRSLAGFKQQKPIVTHMGVVIAGNGSFRKAKDLGWKYIAAVAFNGSREQARAYAIADNQTATSAEWDDDALAELVQGMDEDMHGLLGFDEADLEWLLDPDAAGVHFGDSDPDSVPDVPKVPNTKPGDVWVLGNHRLLCGDATKAEDVGRLLGTDEPLLMVTDPPYGVSLDPSWRDERGANTAAPAEDGSSYMSGGKRDTEARWDEVWKHARAQVCYVWCAAGPLSADVCKALQDAGWDIRQALVWHKGVLTLTRTHYWYTHENCWYGVRKGATAQWCGEAGQSTVWEIPSPKHIMSGSKEEKQPHPAQKPVECMARPIRNHGKKGDLVYDPFVGSGTTIIACEMLDRHCRAIEIEPAYCDVAVKRWETFTGKKAKKERRR